MTARCSVVGVLDNGTEGLSSRALSTLQQADLVIGGKKTLTLFAEQIQQAEQKDLTGQLSRVPEWIQQALADKKQVVVLATGDPLCHGIAGFLCKKLGSDALQILPNVSSVQLAFARIGLSWQDAEIVSIHSKDAGEWVEGAGHEHGLYHLLQAVCRHDKLAILTGPENSPDRIARLLMTEQLDQQFDMTVAEDLLADNERVVKGETIAALAEQSFNGNNIVILQRKQAKPAEVLFGLPDHEFKQRKPDKGLITKREVRAVSLARLQLSTDSIVWDIGAGSGSVGLEAARLCTKGYVYAVEKNEVDFQIAQDNARQLDVHNYRLINAKAPQGMETWPCPDAVFIGGTGGELAELIRLCLNKLNANGWLVMNFVTLENLSTAVETLKTENAVWDVCQLQASRSQAILHMNRMQAENPVWIVSAQRGAA